MMKLLLFLGFCLAFAFVARSFEEPEEVREDEPASGPLKFLKRCRKDDDCSEGECCLRIWWFRRGVCKVLRRENQWCHPNSKCLFRCQDDLECQRMSSVFRFHKCIRPTPPTPTEEPGSGSGIIAL